MKKRTTRKLKQNQKVPQINHEEYLKKLGFKNIVGIDEVGRGSWAGPLVSAAVKLPKNKRLYKLRDSKLLSSKKRENIARRIKKSSAKMGIGMVSVDEINQKGLSWSLQKSYQRALRDLRIKSDFVLIDGNRIKDLDISQKAIIKGDQKCASIAAASIIAKTFRDKIMRQLSCKYWQYRFDRNKGYGTQEHRKALKQYGACEIHRNYRPVTDIKMTND